jgi:hypothetical protein
MDRPPVTARWTPAQRATRALTDMLRRIGITPEDIQRVIPRGDGDHVILGAWTAESVARLVAALGGEVET